jgi:hypothetical protein
MHQQGVVGKQAESIETVYDVLMVSMVGVHHIVLILSDMEVDASTCLIAGFFHQRQPLIGNGEWCVPSDHSLDQRLFTSLALCIDTLGECDIFLHSGAYFNHASIAVGDFIARRATHSHLTHTLGDGFQRAFDEGGAGMMVDAACGTCGNSVQRTNEAGIIASFLIQATVQAPPPFLKNLYEIILWSSIDHHAAGKPRIIVMMRAYHTGDNRFSRCFDHDCSWIRRTSILADCNDGVVLHNHIHIQLY